METEGEGNAGLISRATDWWSFFMNDERHFQGLIGMFLIGILCVFGCCMVTFLCWWHFYYEPILKARKKENEKAEEQELSLLNDDDDTFTIKIEDIQQTNIQDDDDDKID